MKARMLILNQSIVVGGYTTSFYYIVHEVNETRIFASLIYIKKENLCS
jgi:hypothetical protein